MLIDTTTTTTTDTTITIDEACASFGNSSREEPQDLFCESFPWDHVVWDDDIPYFFPF